MNTDRRIRWTAISALAVSCFALGLSVWAAGCRGHDPEAATTRELPMAAHAVGTKATQHALAPAVAPAQNDVHADTTPDQSGPARSAPHAAQSTSPTADGLEVERLVVTRGVAHREPLDTDGITAGAGPVFAFTELRNTSDEDKVITVDFQHAGHKPVGHIRLKVPAHSRRWRTWGRTRLVDQGGQWTAIVRAGDGTELAHAAFDVSAPKS